MIIEKNERGNYRVSISYNENYSVVVEMTKADMEQIQQYMNHLDMMENVRQKLPYTPGYDKCAADDPDYVSHIASCAEALYAEGDNEALSQAIFSAVEETPYQDFCAEEDDNE